MDYDEEKKLVEDLRDTYGFPAGKVIAWHVETLFCNDDSFYDVVVGIYFCPVRKYSVIKGEQIDNCFYNIHAPNYSIISGQYFQTKKQAMKQLQFYVTDAYINHEKMLKKA